MDTVASDRRCLTCRWRDRFACVWGDHHGPLPIWARKYHPVVSGRGEDCPAWEEREETT